MAEKEGRGEAKRRSRAPGRAESGRRGRRPGGVWSKGKAGRSGWKVRAKYAAGILCLAATVLLALYLPGWYSGWQDGRTMGEVSLGTRESIRFLDTETLDISTKLAMLGESERFEYDLIMSSGSGDWSFDSVLRQKEDPFEEGLKLWGENHLVSDEIAALYREGVREGLLVTMDLYIQIDEGVIPVTVGFMTVDDWVNKKIQGIPFERAGLILVMDQGNNFLYYVGLMGDGAVPFWYLPRIGFEKDIDIGMASDDWLGIVLSDLDAVTLDHFPDSSWYGYAAVGNAKSQEVEKRDGLGFYQNATLHYDGFDAMAYSSVLVVESEAGFQVMFGTYRWSWLVEWVLYQSFGFDSYAVSAEEWTDLWNEAVLEYGRDDLVTKMTWVEQQETEIAQDEKIKASSAAAAW